MRFAGALALIALWGAAAQAEDAAGSATTVGALLAHDFAVVGVIPSPAGPGVFLARKGELVVCFVAETKTSRSVATQYCKPVE